LNENKNISIKNILVVRLGKIGDIIAASFVFDVLKKNYTTAKVSLITLKSNSDVIKYNTNIDKTVFVNKNIFSLFQIIKLRRIYFDKIFDLNDDPSTTSKLIIKLLNGKEKIGFAFDITRKFLTTPIEQPSKTKTHIVDRTAFLLENAGVIFDESKKRPVVYLGEKENSDVLNHIKSLVQNTQSVSINISAGAHIRYWKIEYWIELIKLIKKRFPVLKIILLSHPKDKSLRDRILSSFDANSFITPKYFNFQHYASYIYYSDMLITPDTSAIHIASAFRKPIIGLYPNYEWSFVSWQPYKTPHRSIKSTAENISEIQPEEVFNAFLDLSEELKLFN
jgi:ADP-heptose:LPS heptosyltransferase